MTSASHHATMKTSTFVSAVSRDVTGYFQRAGNPVASSVRSWLAQFWWGTERSIHYELWMHERTLQIELGLHFEATAERNREFYMAFGKHLVEIQAELGDTIWLEEWDKGWVRLYETIPLFPLDEARVYAVAGRLCEIMECLQPIYESMAI